jgi:hypothetical protein
MVTRCLIITAIMIIIAASSQGILYGGNEDSGYFPGGYQCSDHSPALKGYTFLAESIRGILPPVTVVIVSQYGCAAPMWIKMDCTIAAAPRREVPVPMVPNRLPLTAKSSNNPWKSVHSS